MLCTKKKSGSVPWFVLLSTVPPTMGLLGTAYLEGGRIKKVICYNILAEPSLKENGSTVQDFISISCFDLRNHFFLS